MGEEVYIVINTEVERNGRKYRAELYRHIPVNRELVRKFFEPYEDCSYKYYIPVEDLEDYIEDELLNEETRRQLKTIYNIAKEEGVIDNEDYIEVVIV